MKNLLTFTSAFAMAATLAGGVAAQDSVLSSEGASDRVSDLQDDINDDFTREVDTFSNRGRPVGFTGSVAARGSLSSGNTEAVDIGIGSNLGYFDGVNGYSLNLSYTYGETDDVVTEESLVYELEYRRDFGPKWFGFAKLQGSIDEFASFDDDTFLGFGAGYRIYDTADLQWTVQAGVGYRDASLTDVANTDFEEGAVALSSNYFNAFTATSAFTVDTDVITSDSDTVVFNSIAFTQNVSDRLALRTSLDTEYHTDPLAGDDSTDNSLGVSLVYSLN